MYNGNYKVASLVYIYNVYVCSKTIFSPVGYICTFHSSNLYGIMLKVKKGRSTKHLYLNIYHNWGRNWALSVKKNIAISWTKWPIKWEWSYKKLLLFIIYDFMRFIDVHYSYCSAMIIIIILYLVKMKHGLHASDSN